MLPRVTSLESDQTIMLIQAACTLMELLVWWESSKSSVQKCWWGHGKSKGGRKGMWDVVLGNLGKFL